MFGYFERLQRMLVQCDLASIHRDTPLDWLLTANPVVDTICTHQPNFSSS
jgi:hypothetical protein